MGRSATFLQHGRDARDAPRVAVQLDAQLPHGRARRGRVQVEGAGGLGGVEEVDEPLGHDHHVAEQALHRRLVRAQVPRAAAAALRAHLEVGLEVRERAEIALELLPNVLEEASAAERAGTIVEVIVGRGGSAADATIADAAGATVGAAEEAAAARRDDARPRRGATAGAGGEGELDGCARVDSSPERGIHRCDSTSVGCAFGHSTGMRRKGRRCDVTTGQHTTR